MTTPPESAVQSPIASKATRFARTRATTMSLVSPLSAEDCQVQSMPTASPVKWHLAHTTWFFETFVLGRDPAYRAFRPEFKDLFNSYYVSIGEAWSRPRRGLVTRPSLAEVMEYRAHVDAALEKHVALGGVDDEERALEMWTIELGLAHEEQHQELLLADVKHLLAQNPLFPAYAPALPSAFGAAPKPRWHSFAGGLVEIGHSGPGFAFDNETPRHKVHLEPFALASRPATNEDWLAFVEDKGYARPELWLSEGFEVVRTQGWRAPLYWIEREGRWHEFTLSGLRPLDPTAPVCHVSGFEADAFARWNYARLPTEAEWEHAAQSLPVRGRFADTRRLHPERAPAGDDGLVQMFGDVWEWTSSDYAPYPRFRPWAGDLAEYNGKFMCNQRVLRGGSCATPSGHVRASYRNFFALDTRWQFTGVRLARDAQ
jgi:ergothioneine biosynthesis protein EgtB